MFITRYIRIYDETKEGETTTEKNTNYDRQSIDLGNRFQFT